MDKIFSFIMRILFPPKCIFCGKVLDTSQEPEICGVCSSMIPFINDKLKLLSARDSAKPYCDEVICLCGYKGIVKDSLIRFKFFNKPSYYRSFSLLLAEQLKKMTNIHEFDIIISVPLHKDKEQARGYNQSYLISKELSGKLGIPECSFLLRRVVKTDSQSLLPREKRYINVSGAFKVTDTGMIKDKSILLVDDILTTGHTLNECARVLAEAGARKVAAAVIASGRNA